MKKCYKNTIQNMKQLLRMTWMETYNLALGIETFLGSLKSECCQRQTIATSRVPREF